MIFYFFIHQEFSMLTQEIRRQFLHYFKNKQHSIITSSPVVPHDDPTLLFTNAGMNQFKDVFLGDTIRDYNRATTAQKCIRVGGKHNDLENVGHTARHLTFFEMLGNFSFGDYFKAEAIQFAWEVSTQVFGFEAERIWPSVFREDEEAFELWTQYVPTHKITRLDEKDNFWAMGEVGPCGPCSELYYDRGPKYGKASKLSEDSEGSRYLEFWNLVFMQYNRSSPEQLTPLPKPSIDTGAGLERVISLKMDVDSVFETDVLRSLIAQVEQVSGIPYDPANPHLAPAFRVIVDHLRCLAFAIADGVQPSNIDRGYVLRKVLRRAVRYGRMLGIEDPFLAKVLPRLVETMGSDYKELQRGHSLIAEILTIEEEAFFRTLRRGGNILNQIIDKAQASSKKITGDEAFKLKDTYGLPMEEILLIAKDSALTVDVERYQILEQEAKERSRSSQKAIQQVASENLYASFTEKHGPTKFVGYQQQQTLSKIQGILYNEQFVTSLEEGQEGIILLDQTPFYAEMGGQIGDLGVIKGDHKLFQVIDCKSPYKGIIAHIGKVEKGCLTTADTLTATIDLNRRQKIANNHTATHLLHWALAQVLGEHIKQAGSVVDAERLRFDFNHHKALTHEEILALEDLINAKIRTNQAVKGYEIPYEEAQKREDIKQFFGEKYSSLVRVVDIDYSKELCGGTHTNFLGTIGYFRIAKESSIAAGVRRIEAVTGAEAEALTRETEKTILESAALLKIPPAKLKEKIEKLLEENKQLSQQLKNLQKTQREKLVHSLLEKMEKLPQANLVASQVDLSPEELRLCAEDLMARFKSGVLILAASYEERCQFIIRVTEDLVARGIQASDIVKKIAPTIEGSGGGKPGNAQAGGKAPHKVEQALAQVREMLGDRPFDKKVG
ncbi:Alanine--tRNA ligase [Neochlamydia sp. AcF95]|nr:Alanine--tRNA ligase [Neochlamydia sp. AcF95]